MLTTPLSSLVAHRLRQARTSTGHPDYRRAQARASTHRMLTDVAAVSSPATVPTAGDVLFAAAAAQALRPPPDMAIDQCHLDVESLCRRVLAICESRPMPDTRIAFIGDDDLALPALFRCAAPQLALLVDIDERVIAAAQTDASRAGYADRVSVERADLSSSCDVEGVCDRYGESFDVVVTDPPYAQDGMLRFVDVAMALTAYTGEVHIAVPALLAEAWTDELLHAVQARLVAEGFVIDQVIPGAFAYETSDVISCLVVARRLPGSSAASNPNRGVGRFYTTRVVPDQVPLLVATSTSPECP